MLTMCQGTDNKSLVIPDFSVQRDFDLWIVQISKANIQKWATWHSECFSSFVFKKSKNVTIDPMHHIKKKLFIHFLALWIFSKHIQRNYSPSNLHASVSADGLIPWSLSPRICVPLPLPVSLHLLFFSVSLPLLPREKLGLDSKVHCASEMFINERGAHGVEELFQMTNW